MTDQPKQSNREVVEGLLDDLEAQTFNVAQSGPDAFLNERSGRDDTRSRILSIVEELEKRVNDLTQENMAYEYMDAETEKYLPEVVRQQRDRIVELEADLASLKAQGERVCKWRWDVTMGLYASECGPQGSVRWHSAMGRNIHPYLPFCDVCGKPIQSTVS